MYVCNVHGCNRTAKKMNMCLAHYTRVRNHGDAMPDIPIRVPRGALLNWVNDVAINFKDEECLNWPFGKDKDGYGSMRFKGKYCRAHRVVLEISSGPPPSEDSVCRHLCGKGHEGCVNPMHLMWGSHVDNAQDRILHGTDLAGERNGRCILSDDDVLFIYGSKGKIRQIDLAKIYGVSRSAIAHIHSGKNRSEITGIQKPNGR